MKNEPEGGERSDPPRGLLSEMKMGGTGPWKAAQPRALPQSLPFLLSGNACNEMAAFAQDDWRVSPSFTLSLGLRYELFLNPYEDRNRLAMFDVSNGAIVVASDHGQLPVSQYLPAVVAKLTDANGNWKLPLLSDVQAGYTPQRLLATQWNNWGPRIGFAWHASRKTVVRSGYGIFYSRYPIQYLLQTVAVNPPFAGTFNYSQSIQNGVPAITLSAPYAAGGSATVAPSGIQQNFELPNNQQWNFTIERETRLEHDRDCFLSRKQRHPPVPFD